MYILWTRYNLSVRAAALDYSKSINYLQQSSNETRRKRLTTFEPNFNKIYWYEKINPLGVKRGTHTLLSVG